jgi:hypothetical protein
MPTKHCLLLCLTALITLAAPAGAQERLDLPGGFQPDPASVDYIATGTVAAGEAVRRCPGFAAVAPALVVGLSDPGQPLHFYLTGDGAAGLLLAGPDGLYRCETPGEGGITHLRSGQAQAGEYLLWPLAPAPGASVSGALLVSEADMGQGDIAALAGSASGQPGAGGMPGAMPGGMPPGMENPFAGVELKSVAQALGILTDALGLKEMLTYDRLEETGPEGFVLHNVVLRGPAGAGQPVRIGTIRVGDLDLAGLSANGAPERFSLAIEGITYADIAGDAAGFGVPLPELANPAPLSVSLSLLPPGGDQTRRELKIELGFEGQLALALSSRVVWPQGATAMGPMGAAMMVQGEAIELEMHDMGFLGAALREAAKENGQTPDELVSQTLQEMAASLAPMPPGSPQERLYRAVAAKLGAIDQKGRLSVSFKAARPMGMDTLMQALSQDQIDESLVKVEAAYTPDP